MSLSYIVSLLFFITFAICIFLGIYILFLNTNNRLNRIYFAVCLSLSVWALGFSIANTALDYEMSLFWRRVSCLGWGTIHSILLHFILILTERSKILKNKWLYVLLYLPVTVNVYAFGLNSDLAREQYNLVYTVAGWVNVSENTWGDWYFNFYYVSFAISGLWLLWSWGRSSIDPKKKKQAHLLMFSFAMAILLGTITDLIMYRYMSINVPQVSSIISMIPIGTSFYAIKRYGLMGPIEKSEEAEPGKILSEVNLVKFYHIMSMVFILGGMLNFAARYYVIHAPLTSVLLFSAFLCTNGILLQIIQRIPNENGHQDTAFIILVSISIPLITLRFIESASITVWAVSFIFVIPSIIFNRRRMMFWLGISILFTQIWVWIKVPIAMVQVDGSDHIVRIGIYSMTLWMAFYVNRIYIQRIKENEAQIKFQKMVSQISADFVTVTESNLDKKIKGVLQLSGEVFQVDRTYLSVFFQDPKTVTYTCEWCNEGIEPAKNNVRMLSADTFPCWVSQILKNEVVHIPDVEMLPLEAGEEKELLRQQQIQSLLSIPVTNKGKILGFLRFDSVKETKTWRGDHQELLRILANLLADALVKVEAEKEINYMAYYDALTGLPNRILLKNQLEQAIHLARGTEKLIGVVFIDMDSFKAVNDTMGHEGGDEMLKEVARRLSGCVRKHDTVSRFGGDEFLVKITQIHRVDDIRKIVDNIMKSFNLPVIVKNQEFFITVSAGIAVYPTDGEEAETLIKNADLAMYISKDKGKNQYTLCSPVMKEDELKKMQLTNSLYRAQERNELVLYYQPQVSALTKEIIGLEALIRWKHPDLGMVSPGIFIPLAEKTGLINPIGQWVLQTACHQNKKWQELGLPPIRMAVNISVEQFRNPNLVSLVARTLSEIGLDSKYLELEITESTAVKEEGYIIQVLHELKALGVTIAIDDFGTEYSSLSRLKTLPVDRIKIDMQFVHGISEGNKDEAIAKIIIQLAKNLRIDVIAEGVETEKQFEFFRKHMCDEIQGYYFYKPMPVVELEEILFSQFKKK